jgi:Cellulose binding domain
LHIEPDFFQYSYGEQNNGGLSSNEASSEMNKWTTSIKEVLPNSSLILDVSPWNNDIRGWSSKFQNFDYAGIVGKRFEPVGRGEVDGKTYKQISNETGKKLIINDSHGVGGWWLPFNYNWAIKELASSRYNDGVSAVILPPNDLTFLNELQKLNNTWNQPPAFPFPIVTPPSNPFFLSSSSSISSSSVPISSSISSSVSSSSSVQSSQTNPTSSSTSNTVSSSTSSASNQLSRASRSICMSNSVLMTFTKKSTWEKGYTGVVKIKNNSSSPVIDWSIVLQSPNGYKINDSWNLNVENKILTPKYDWNKQLKPNEEIEVGGINTSFENDLGLEQIKCNAVKAKTINLPYQKAL